MTQASTTSMQAERAQGPLLPMVDKAPNFRAWFVAVLVSVATWIVAVLLIRWWLS